MSFSPALPFLTPRCIEHDCTIGLSKLFDLKIWYLKHLCNDAPGQFKCKAVQPALHQGSLLGRNSLIDQHRSSVMGLLYSAVRRLPFPHAVQRHTQWQILNTAVRGAW